LEKAAVVQVALVARGAMGQPPAALEVHKLQTALPHRLSLEL